MNASDAPPPTPVVVFDLAALRFRFGPGRRSVSVASVTGEHLATVAVPASVETAEAAFAAVTAAAESSRVLRPVAGSVEPVGFACAFYNPYTSHVAFTGPDGVVVFTPDRPWPVPAAGLPGRVQADPEGGLLLVTDAGSAPAADLDSAAVSRALAAYL